MTRPIPPAAIAFIKKHEGLRLKPYYDTGRRATIGFGHLLSPVVGMALSTWRPITEGQAEALLAGDLERMAGIIGTTVRVPLSENEYSALLSLAFNIPLALTKSTLLTMLNTGDRKGAAKQFERWCKEHRNGVLVENAGLKARRLDEAALFLKV